LRWDRAKAYPERPKTLDEHLLKRRCESGFTQQQISFQLLVKVDTYCLWENGRSKPLARHFPAIFRFLGYDPLPPPTTLGGHLERKRLLLGLTYRAAARLAGVEEGTFRRWTTGEWKPRMSQGDVDRFLAAATP